MYLFFVFENNHPSMYILDYLATEEQDMFRKSEQ